LFSPCKCGYERQDSGCAEGSWDEGDGGYEKTKTSISRGDMGLFVFGTAMRGALLSFPVISAVCAVPLVKQRLRPLHRLDAFDAGVFDAAHSGFILARCAVW